MDQESFVLWSAELRVQELQDAIERPARRVTLLVDQVQGQDGVRARSVAMGVASRRVDKTVNPASATRFASRMHSGTIPGNSCSTSTAGPLPRL